MTKPVKNPPKAQIEAGEKEILEASAPILAVETKDSSFVANDRESAPTLDPPFAVNETTPLGFGAGVWNNDKKVNGLFSTNQTRNSWMSIADTGWVKLDDKLDSVNAAFTILASSAKVKNSSINYLLDGEQVTEIYVW